MGTVEQRELIRRIKRDAVGTLANDLGLEVTSIEYN